MECFTETIPTLKQLIQANPQLRTSEEISAYTAQVEKVIYNDFNINELVQTATTILTRYCEIYAKKIPMPGDSPRKVRFTYTRDIPANAYYDHGTNEIFINLARISLCSILEMGKKMAQCELTNNRLVSISNGRSGILNHELEHARRGDCTGHNAHAYGHDAKGNYVDFEACASSYALKAHTSGLFVEWAKDLQGLSFPSDETLAKVLEVEKTHPEILIALF